MLAERVKEWTREWEQQGFKKGLEKGLEKGRKQGLQKVRAALVHQLEKRFGPLPEEARQRIDALDHEAIVELSVSLSTAPSLAALGLS